MSVTNQTNAVLQWTLVGKNATARCGSGCSFYCKMDTGAEKFCGFGLVGQNLSVTYLGLKDGPHVFVLNVTEAGGAFAGTHTNVFSVDTIPPSAIVSPLFHQNVIDLGGVSMAIYSWPNNSAIPFAICLDKPAPFSLTADMLQVSSGTIVSFAADETVPCPPAQDKSAGIVSADSAGALKNKSETFTSKAVYVGQGEEKLLVVSGGATRYRLLVQPAKGTGAIVQASVKNGSFYDYAGNQNIDNLTSNGLVLFDVRQPVPRFVQLTDGKREITSALYTFAIDFGEQISNFSAQKIACINCAVTGFAPVHPGVYGVDITINPGTTAQVSVPAGAAHDYAGHQSLASSVFKVTRYTVNKGAQGTSTSALVAGLAFVGAAMVIPTTNINAVNHPLQAIQRLQAYALTGHYAVTYPASYQSAVSSAQFVNFNIKSPIEHSLFGGTKRAVNVKQVGQTVGSPPPAGGVAAASVQSHARHLLLSPGDRAAAASNSSNQVAPSIAPAPGPSSPSDGGSDCNGNTGLGADGGCSSAQSLANSQYLAVLSPDAFASVASNSIQNDLQDPGANGLRQAARVLFYVGAVLVLVVALQLLWPFLERRWNVQLPGLLRYPTFQVFYGGIALAGVVALSTQLIVGGTAAGISIAVVLLLIYALYLVWCMWTIYVYTIKESRIKFVVRNAQPPKGSMLKTVIGDDYPDAEWKAESESLLGAYGILFESVKGYKYKAPAVEPPPKPPQDPNTGAYLEARWDDEFFGPGGAPLQVLAPEVELKPLDSMAKKKFWYMASARQMYFVIDIASQIWIALVMGAYPYNSNARPQVYCIIVLKVLEIGILWLLKPQISPDDFIVLLIGKLCDLGTAVCNFFLLNPNISTSENLNIAWALLVFQLVAIFIVVLWFWYLLMRDAVVPYIMSIVCKKRKVMASTHGGIIQVTLSHDPQR